MSETSPLRHPTSRRLLKLYIFSRDYWELSRREQRARDVGVAVCSEIHKRGWNIERREACIAIIKEFE